MQKNLTNDEGVIAWCKIPQFKESEMNKKQAEKEKECNKDWMYLQRERNELGADYLSYQGYHPPKK